MTDGARELFRRIAVFFGAGFGNEFEAALALTAKAQNFSFVTDEEVAVVAHQSIFFEFGRARRTQIAIIPHKFQRRHCAARRKFIGDHRSERISLGVDPSGTGLNADWVVVASLTPALSPSEGER